MRSESDTPSQTRGLVVGGRAFASERIAATDPLARLHECAALWAHAPPRNALRVTHSESHTGLLIRVGGRALARSDPSRRRRPSCASGSPASASRSRSRCGSGKAVPQSRSRSRCLSRSQSRSRPQVRGMVAFYQDHHDDPERSRSVTDSSECGRGLAVRVSRAKLSPNRTRRLRPLCVCARARACVLACLRACRARASVASGVRYRRSD